MGTELATQKDMTPVVSPVLARATALVIVTPQDYALAGEECKAIAGAIKLVHDECDPLCKATEEAHNKAVAFRNKFLIPLEAAKKAVSKKQTDWSAEAERVRLAEQKRLQDAENERVRKIQEAAEAQAKILRDKEAEANRLAEEARQKAAAEQDAVKRASLQKEADRKQAEATAAAARAEAKEEKAATAAPTPIFVPSAVPTVKGQHEVKTWKARITDTRAAAVSLMAFPDWQAYITIKDAELTKFAVRTKGAVKVNGVEFYESTGLASSAR